MKKLVPFLLLGSFLLGGCSKSLELKPFTYSNDAINIVDTFPVVIHQTAHVVMLYGQSNADGVSHNEYLQKNNSEKYNEYLNGYNNVYINYINDNLLTSSLGEFVKCTLGCGCSPTQFGPEMGIAEMMSKTYPGDQTFIIKWTWGGTTLHNQWLNAKRGRGDLYNDAMDFTLKCLKYLAHKGYRLSIDGICWMQGENDSLFKNENQYYNDTKDFVTLLRYDLSSYQEKIRFIDAGINEEPGIWIKPELVNKAKKRFSNESPLNYYLDPVKMGLSSTHEPEDAVDFAHFDSMSMVKLGQEFGEIVSE